MTTNGRAWRRRCALAGTAAVSLLALGWSDAALASDWGEPGYRGFKGELLTEFHMDHTFDSDDPDNELTDTFNKSELALDYFFNPRFLAHGTFVFEPVLDPDPGESRFFEDEGLYAEEFYGKLLFGQVSVLGGKFNPTFGTAFERAPGVYGNEFGEDYETTERVGTAVAIESNPTPIGTLTLTGNLYRLDTGFLSGSLFTDREDPDGGLSDTSGLESYSITLEGADIAGMPGIGYHLGHRHQAAGPDNDADENGYVAAVYGEHEMNSVGFAWLAEVAIFDDWEGEAGADARYWTLGGIWTFAKRYNAAISYTSRDIDNSSGDFDDHLFTASVGKEIYNGWTLDLGYKHTEEENVKSHTVGLLLAKTFTIGPSE